MKKLSDTIKRIIIFFIGMSIIQFGVALFLRMNIGSDPFTVFTQGLANTLNNLGINVTTGTANRIILIILFSIILLLNKSHIKIGTLICVIGVGPIIDLGISIVSILPIESYSYVVKMLLIALGCFIIAIGFSILSATKVGVAPNDIIPFIIKERINWEFKWIRILLDAVFYLLFYIRRYCRCRNYYSYGHDRSFYTTMLTIRSEIYRFYTY